MIRRSLAWAAALLAASACALWVPGGTRLARWQRDVVELRELDFAPKPGVELREVDADGVLRVLTRELVHNYPAEYVDAYEAAYKALGLIPRDVDLVRVLLALQVDQVVGLYTPSDDVMYVRSDLPPGTDEVDAIVIHELVHALQARHFGASMGLLRGLRHNDDVSAGVAAATEGDASFTMLGFVPPGSRDDGPVSGLRSVDTAVRLRRVIEVDLDHPTGVFARAPRLLQRSLLFPYAEGVVLAARHYEAQGNAGLDRLLHDPPLSTRQVYTGANDAVDFIRLPSLQPLPAACSAGHHNVVGSLGVRVLLEEHVASDELSADAAATLAKRWSGDRFAHVSCPDGDQWIWYTRWDDADAAREFARAYALAAPSIVRRAGLGARPVAEQRGREVLVLSAGLLDRAEQVRDGAEIRSYRTFGSWVADDCFSESPCPFDPPSWRASRRRSR